MARLVRSVAEFLSTLRKTPPEGGPDWSRCWFRGQPLRQVEPQAGFIVLELDHEKVGFDHNPLVPRVLRSDRFNERFLAHTFRLRAGSRYSSCPPLDEYPRWLFLMQHYGLPTRLLDWTASPLVALFFAVEDGLSDPFAAHPSLKPC